MPSLMRRNNSLYAKLEKEDPQEKTRREAQFLIYKTLNQADRLAMQRSYCSFSWLKLRMCKFKVKIGKRFLRLRKNITILSPSTMAKSKIGVCKNVIGHIKSFKRLLSGRGSGGNVAIRRLPRPIFV